MDDIRYTEERGYKVGFSYTDEFNQTTTLNKTLSICQSMDGNEFEMLVDQFRIFLKSCGFDDELVSSIKY